MKRMISVLMAMALAAFMAVSGNVLASDAVEQTQETVEQVDVVVEEGKEVVEEAAGHQEVVEQTVEEIKEEVKEEAPAADK